MAWPRPPVNWDFLEHLNNFSEMSFLMHPIVQLLVGFEPSESLLPKHWLTDDAFLIR